MSGLRVLAFGAWDEGMGYPRPAGLFLGLRRNGITVDECRVKLPAAGRGRRRLVASPWRWPGYWLAVRKARTQTPMMMVDRDFIVTYCNESTMALLGKHERAFREVYGSFDASKILGTCIDSFHKDPSHQRRMLENPDNLPYETEIKVGDLQFKLIVSAQKDLQGTYIGNTLEWEDITEQKNAGRALFLQVEQEVPQGVSHPGGSRPLRPR